MPRKCASVPETSRSNAMSQPNLALGDGLRPSSIADANYAAQFAELATLGDLPASPGVTTYKS